MDSIFDSGYDEIQWAPFLGNADYEDNAQDDSAAFPFLDSIFASGYEFFQSTCCIGDVVYESDA